MTAPERKILLRIFRAMIPEAGGWNEASAAELQAILQAAPPLMRFGIRFSLWFFQLTPVFFTGRPLPFTALSPLLQDRILVRAGTSRIYLIRQLAVTVKMVACLVYFSPAAEK